jgi:hypothetical protein
MMPDYDETHRELVGLVAEENRLNAQLKKNLRSIAACQAQLIRLDPAKYAEPPGAEEASQASQASQAEQAEQLAGIPTNKIEIEPEPEIDEAVIAFVAKITNQPGWQAKLSANNWDWKNWDNYTEAERLALAAIVFAEG